MCTRINKLSCHCYFIKLLMRDEFIRFQNYKNRVALRFRVQCASTLSRENIYIYFLFFSARLRATSCTWLFSSYTKCSTTIAYRNLEIRRQLPLSFSSISVSIRAFTFQISFDLRRCYTGRF